MNQTVLKIKEHFSIGIVYIISLCLVAACGGGGGGGANEVPAITSVNGIVADGYLVGASVFSDLNVNMMWDEGEPRTTTGEGGKFSLVGDNIDQYPIVVYIDTNAIDSDTNSRVHKKYILSAPVGITDFISPITTLIHQMLIVNPDLSVKEAEALVNQQIGALDNISLFEDYIAGEKSNEGYTTLHQIAQIVAATYGERLEQAEMLAQDAGYNPNENMDALVQVVTQNLLGELWIIAEIVKQIEYYLDPVTVAEAISIEYPLTKEIVMQRLNQSDDQNENPISNDNQTILFGSYSGIAELTVSYNATYVSSAFQKKYIGIANVRISPPLVGDVNIETNPFNLTITTPTTTNIVGSIEMTSAVIKWCDNIDNNFCDKPNSDTVIQNWEYSATDIPGLYKGIYNPVFLEDGGTARVHVESKESSYDWLLPGGYKPLTPCIASMQSGTPVYIEFAENKISIRFDGKLQDTYFQDGCADRVEGFSLLIDVPIN